MKHKVETRDFTFKDHLITGTLLAIFITGLFLIHHMTKRVANAWDKNNSPMWVIQEGEEENEQH